MAKSGLRYVSKARLLLLSRGLLLLRHQEELRLPTVDGARDRVDIPRPWTLRGSTAKEERQQRTRKVGDTAPTASTKIFISSVLKPADYFYSVIQ